jgi:hypothetical protein
VEFVYRKQEKMYRQQAQEFSSISTCSHCLLGEFANNATSAFSTFQDERRRADIGI